MSKAPLGDWRPTYSELLYRLNNAGGLSDIQRQNAERIAEQYRKSLIAQRDRLLDGMSDHNQRTQEKVAEKIDKLAIDLAEAIEQIKSGEGNGKSLMALAAETQRDLRRWTALSDEASESEERAWEQADVTPEQFQENALARFPALKSRLPLITEESFEGRHEPKF